MYTDDERRIYSAAVNGRPPKLHDPAAVRRRLVIATKGRFNELLQRHDGDDEVAAALAEEELVAAARDAFGLPPLGDAADGYTDAEAMALLDNYLEWLGNCESDSAKSPTSQPPTADCPA